jgi:hypothetical protein
VDAAGALTMEELDEIRRWFAERGFGIRLWQEPSRGFWADLTRPPADRVVAPRYGSGDSEIGAARRARERYQQEQ